MASFSHCCCIILPVFLSSIILINCIQSTTAEASIGPSITGGYNKLSFGSKFCRCVSIQENCTNPILQLSRFKCQKDYQYCCNRGELNEKHGTSSAFLSALQPSSINSSFSPSTQPKEQKDDKRNSTVTKSLNNFNSRVKVVLLTEFLTTEQIPTQKMKQQQESIEERNKMNCKCKSRESCPEEFTDYGFGFFCAHDTVRCCEPVNDFLEDKRTPPAIAMMNASTDEPKIETENNTNVTSNVDENCQCTSIEQCELALEKQNEIERKRRQDSICPDNLIHCCHLKTDNNGSSSSSSNETSDQLPLILDVKEESKDNLNLNKVYNTRGDNLDDLLIMTPASRVEMTTVAALIPPSSIAVVVVVKEEDETKTQGPPPLENIDQSPPVPVLSRPVPSVQPPHFYRPSPGLNQYQNPNIHYTPPRMTPQQYQQAILMQQKLNKYYYNNNNNQNSMRGFSQPSFLSSLANFLG